MLAEINTNNVETSTVQLANGGDAFLARPATPGLHPTIVLLHERYGLVQHTKDLAVRFAVDGHVALAPNLYFRAPNQDAVARGEETVALDDQQVIEDAGATIAYFTQVPGADTSRLALMGVCATGRHPLVVAAARTDVAACVVFYGAAYRREWVPVETLRDAIAGSAAPVFGVFGELDNLIGVEDVQRFRNALETARRSYEFLLYGDAPHGFLNDTMPGRYRRLQAESAWAAVIAFLDRVHGGHYAADRVLWSFSADHATTYDFTKNVRME